MRFKDLKNGTYFVQGGLFLYYGGKPAAGSGVFWRPAFRKDGCQGVPVGAESSYKPTPVSFCEADEVTPVRLTRSGRNESL